MIPRVEKASSVGFCFGVRRAIDILEKAASTRDRIETLGAIVHNQQVRQRLAQAGIIVANNLNEIKGNTVAIGAHGIGPQLEEEVRARYTDVINTTCPFVRRAQLAAHRLAKSGFFAIIYGEANHPEVKGILGWANGKGLATVDDNLVAKLEPLPRRLGILSQTTQIPIYFNQFIRRIIDFALIKDAELRIIDTICHDIRERQQKALELAKRVDLMLVVGSHTSANTSHLAELCTTITKTYFIETAQEMPLSWFEDHPSVGITGGASTDESTINEILTRLLEIGYTQ